MRHNFSYLKDNEFLNKIFARRVKNHYAKIILLDFKTENLYKEYVGRVTAGTVTLSASSAVRRTCSLTAAAEETENDFTNIDSDISINKKFQLLIGYENDLPEYQNIYDKIIWFPLGLFIFTGVSISRGSNGLIISITGKDKMCLLNGEIGGEICANTTFNEKYIYQDDGTVQIEYPTIFQIIQEAVNHLGGEDLNNIVINNIPNQIKRPVQYNNSKPLYFGNDKKGELIFSLKASDIKTLIAEYDDKKNIGYKYLDFSWPGEDLIMNAGSNVATLLQQISDKLGNYEFFYSKEGIFFFQEIQNYLNTSYIPLNEITNNNYVVNFGESNSSVYTFNQSDLVLNYTNTPNYANIKNDFYVWGALAESETPILFHLAIDDKPVPQSHSVVFYKNDKGETCVRPPHDDDKQKNISTVTPSDWRYELYLRILEEEKLGLHTIYYEAELKNNFPLIFDFELNDFKEEIYNEPEKIVYWLDFIETDSIIGKFSVNNIGRRIKAITDTNLTAIYHKDIKDVIIINKEQYLDDENERMKFETKCYEMDLAGQKYSVIDNKLDDLLSLTNITNTCFDKIRELLQQYTYYNETITINSLPLYFLEPNTRITVNNKASGIEGDYIIQTLNMPLAPSGQMTLTASRATTKI